MSSTNNLKTKKKIKGPALHPTVLITAPYFKPRSGGLEEYAFQIAKGLQEAYAWRVLIVTSGDQEEMKSNSYQGLAVRHLPYSLKISNTPYGFDWSSALKTVIAEERPDIIVAHAPVPGMLDVTAKQTKKLPFVVTYHFGSMHKGKFWPDIVVKCYETFILPRIFRKSQAIICTSRFIKQSGFMASSINKTTVINPGVTSSLFTPPIHRTPACKLLHVGGLKTGEEHKGLETSLLIVDALKSKYPEVQLAIVGEGDRRAYFEMLSSSLGLEENVEFLGRVDHSAMRDVYRTSDILLLPSQEESFGMVVIEAMSCGVPVVASGIDGTPEPIRNGKTGYIVAPGDTNAFVRKISKLFDDHQLMKQFSRAARIDAENMYQWKDKVAETHTLLLQCIAKYPNLTANGEFRVTGNEG